MVTLDLWRNDRIGPRSLMDLFQKDLSEVFGRSFDSMRQGELGYMVPDCDVEEIDGAFMLSMDLPGVKREDIDVSVEGGNLIISGKRESKEKTENDGYLRIERRGGSFKRSFKLPDGVTAEDISANYEDGVLGIKLPKIEAGGKKRIVVGDNKKHLKGVGLGKKNSQAKAG